MVAVRGDVVVAKPRRRVRRRFSARVKVVYSSGVGGGGAAGDGGDGWEAVGGELWG